MINRLFIIIAGLSIGMVGGYFLKQYLSENKTFSSVARVEKKKTVIGFLPYWLLDTAKKDYSSTITMLTYFGLTIDSDGSIVKLANEQQEDPGWHVLKSGLMNNRFDFARQKNIKLSLLVFSQNRKHIAKLIGDPKPHAHNLVTDVIPLMKQYGFTDLNLDIETADIASESARKNFTTFVSTLKQELGKTTNTTLTIESSPTALFKNYLLDPQAVAPFVDSIVFMTYDYHHQNSSVVGAVSPLYGGGETLELDVNTVIQKAQESIPKDKILMGIPLYGYQWETIDVSPRAPIIPGTGLTTSNKHIEDFLSSCATCSAQFDETAKESYVIYKDQETGTYYQIYYPDKRSMQEKITFAKNEQVAGVALWALGYEGSTILEPLKNYK